MALIPINVTLSSQEPNSGPLYDIYYSIDGTNYILALADANLPDVGSSVVVNVEDTYCRIRLVDASSACEGTTNTIDFGICCSPATNPVFRLEYDGYTTGNIWSGSDTLPKSASVVGGNLTTSPTAQAWVFDGFNDYFTISSGALAGMQPVNNLTEANDFTITFAGYFFSGSGEKPLLYAGSAAIPSGQLKYSFTDQSNKMSLNIISSLNFAQPSIKALLNILPSSSLQSIAVKQEGSNVSVYQNGTLVTSSAMEWGLFNRISATTTQAIFFGDTTSGVGTTFNGALNSFNIYSRSLSDSEIYSDYLFYAQNCVTPTTTTTTTSTTSTSTTTTTTTAPPDCRINTTINVTETGWIRWTLCDGTVQDTFLSSLGTYTITQCILYNSIRAAIPLAELADWDNVVWGTSCTTGTTTTTTTTAGPIQVTGVFGYMQPCIGGTIDDYMGASVNLSAPVSVDTEVVVDVKYVFPGSSCGVGEYSQLIFLTIPSGSQNDNFNACTNGIYFSGGTVICDACVYSCDNPAIDFSAQSC
jgi:hypothetical protein